MKPFSEIIAEHYSEDSDELDLQAIVAAAEKEMGGVLAPSPADAINMLDEHYAYAIRFIGGLVLSTADEVGALPDGFDAAYEDLLRALEFDKFRRLYEYKRSKTEKKIEVVEA